MGVNITRYVSAMKYKVCTVYTVYVLYIVWEEEVQERIYMDGGVNCTVHTCSMNVQGLCVLGMYSIWCRP